MKYLLIVLLFFTTLSANAQTVRNIPFDFNQIPCNVNTKELVGQQLYFFKPNRMFLSEESPGDTLYQTFVSDKETPINSLIPYGFVNKLKYGAWRLFNPLSGTMVPYYYDKNMNTRVYKPILALGNGNVIIINTPYSAFENKLFTIVDCKDSTIDHGKTCMFKFTLKDPNGENIYWWVSQRSLQKYPICFKSFLTYLKEHYVGQKMYIKRSIYVRVFYANPMDKRTYESQPGQEWTCTSMTLLNDPTEIFPSVALLLQGKSNVLAIDPGKRMTGTLMPLSRSDFWTEPEYKAYMEKENKRLDSLKNARDAQQKRFEKKQPAYVKETIKKYGKDYGMHLVRDEVAIGMPEAICKVAWGKPKDKWMEVNNKDTVDVWKYTEYKWLRFRKDKLEMYNE